MKHTHTQIQSTSNELSAALVTQDQTAQSQAPAQAWTVLKQSSPKFKPQLPLGGYGQSSTSSNDCSSY